MANNYFQQTGVLILGKITPVIKGLFGAYGLDEKYPGNGQTYIATESEGCDPIWGSIQIELYKMLQEMNLLDPAEEAYSIRDQLLILGKHFKIDEMELEELLREIPEEIQENADLDVLYQLACLFDDGHKLKGIAMEGAWTCSEPRLFEFGGVGFFIGTGYAYNGTSSEAMQFARDMNNALVTNNMHSAITLLQTRIKYMLFGVHNDQKRQALIKSIQEMELE